MEQVILYIYGKDGSPEEAIHYRPLFSGRRVIGLDYAAQSPWEAKMEFPALFNAACRDCQSVEIIANSIGAYFAINALTDKRIKKAYFISPIVDMEKLISDMMAWAHVTEKELRAKKEIPTDFGDAFLGISLLCTRAPHYLDCPHPHSIWRKGLPDILRNHFRLCGGNPRRPHGNAGR